MRNGRSEVAEMIDVSRGALAQWVVNEQFERRPSLEGDYGPGARAAWVEDTHVRLAHLSDALAMDRPELFVEYVAWTGASFSARKRPVEDVKVNLEAIRSVLASELPAHAAEAAGAQIEAALERLSTLNGQTPASALQPDRPHAELAAKYLTALLDGRRDDAARLIDDAIDAGVGLADLYEHVFQPAQAELGRLWHMGEISVADEHMCTASTQMVMSRAFARAHRAAAKERTVVVASAAGDLHDMGGRMVADHFELEGWRVYFLGANTPTDALIETLLRRNADALAISCSYGGVVRNVAGLIEAVRGVEGLKDLLILVGGAPFAAIPGLWKQVGADASAADGRAAVRVADELLDAQSG